MRSLVVGFAVPTVRGGWVLPAFLARRESTVIAVARGGNLVGELCKPIDVFQVNHRPSQVA